MNLSDLTISQLENKMGEWLSKCNDAASAHSVAKSDYELHHAVKKSIVDAIIKITSGPYNMREVEAHTHPKYLEWLEASKPITRAYNDAVAVYDSAKRNVDCIRSLITTRREEMKRFVS